MTTQSVKNMLDAFIGEAQANRRYLAYAAKAREEGYPHLARLFRAIAESETIHAINHLKAAGEVKSTIENLEAALKGETQEFTSMYPMFMDQAKRDADNAALKTFFWANEAEKVHGGFYERGLGTLREGKDLVLEDLHICTVCGYTVEGYPPDKCPVCGEKRDKFKLVP